MKDIVWDIKKGDLVKIRHYRSEDISFPPYGRQEESIYYTTGIVISDAQEERDYQTLIFPYVKVYVFDIREVRTYGPGSLEILIDEE